ncbi:MAG: 2-oxo acid dehydrogenase subunit E2, partial [Pseudomonadota bacterium]|nr:2-oxo acid dehydrogenase subunit E2 [Pseudomonadota bacterium]
SLNRDGASLTQKKYINIGIAVNTSKGLIVPVIRNVEKKGIIEIAGEIQELASKARDNKISPKELQGGTFTISNLGSLSGTSFTPVINVPEVAILGVSPSRMSPVWDNGTFVPRLMLPITLSYDHRVIDGVAGAQFTSYFTEILGDIRQALM